MRSARSGMMLKQREQQAADTTRGRGALVPSLSTCAACAFYVWLLPDAANCSEQLGRRRAAQLQEGLTTQQSEDPSAVERAKAHEIVDGAMESADLLETLRTPSWQGSQQPSTSVLPLPGRHMPRLLGARPAQRSTISSKS